MAVVNIPYGGQSVGIEVPDFAMEGTQQDVLEQARSQTDVLQQIAAKMGISVQKADQTVKTNEEISREISAGNREMNLNLRGLARNGINLSNRATQAMVAGKEKLSDLIGEQGILGNLGLVAMGAQVGSVIGIMEELGSTMGAMRRTGVGFGADLLDLRAQAADAGFGFETLAKITAENGNAIRALGPNSLEGTRNFLALNNELRNATEAAGFFGLSSREMSAMLIDEIDLRRQTRNESFLEAGSRANLIESMKENLRLNEVMASLTGQDVQDRIKARNEFRRNAVVAAAARSLNEEQLQAQNTLIENLSGLGPSVTPIIQQAMANMIAGIPLDRANEGFTRLAAAAAENGIDLRSNLENLNAMTMAAASPEEMLSASQALVDMFKNAEVSSGFISRAAAGQEGAMLFLTTQQEAFGTAAENIAETTTMVENEIARFGGLFGDASAQLAGTAAAFEEVAERMRTETVTAMLDTLDIDIRNPQGFVDFVDMVSQVPQSEGFKNFIDLAMETSMFATGAEGFLRSVGINGSPEDAVQAGQNVAAMATFLARIAEAAGVPGAGLSADVASAGNFVIEAGRITLTSPNATETVDEDGNPVEDTGMSMLQRLERIFERNLKVEVQNFPPPQSTQ